MVSDFGGSSAIFLGRDETTPNVIVMHYQTRRLATTTSLGITKAVLSSLHNQETTLRAIWSRPTAKPTTNGISYTTR